MISTTRPPPLRTDTSNAFAHFSMRVRVPDILTKVVAENPDYPERVKASIAHLADAIRSNGILPPLGIPAPDEGEWIGAIDGRSWLATEWFLAEGYVYRCLASVSRFWETGRDPFAPAKCAELASADLWELVGGALELGPADAGERVSTLLALALWGNRADLSYAVGSAFGKEGTIEDLLVDDRPWAVAKLATRGGNVHIVADNTGRELSMDLVLADALMSAAGARVTLHVKMHPTFVSDATARDVWDLVDALRARGGPAAELAARLGQSFAEERLRIVPDFFWNGPRFLWDRPPRLARELDPATMVVLKGDANYRRAVGDAMWPADVTFSEATAYFPAPLLCIRTMKCDALVGLTSARRAALDAVDKDWRINGRRGLIQGKER